MWKRWSGPELAVTGALAAGLWVAGAPARGATPFSVRDVMAAPFASELVTSPDGRAIAWVVNDRGVRNVWVASAPAYEGRALTAYAREDGQELSELAFSVDGRRLVYVRGSSPSRAGEVPNPTSETAGAEQALFSASLEGGAPVKLGDGASPAVAPDGTVAFVKDGKVLAAPIDASSEAKPLFKARGRAAGLRWSPDGRRLAFVSRRGGHSFVGVFERGASAIVWLDPGVDRDEAPAWSPDSRQIAFLRLPQNPRAYPFLPEREGHPFSIRVADAATGAGRLVWQARAGRGSVFREVVGDNLWWTAGDRLVFPWEQDGFTHLYSTPVAGGPATLLTPGDSEVEHAALGKGAREMLFSSNQGDLDRRHVFRVGVGGGAPLALTSGEGIEWAPAPLADGVALIRSDARRPSRVAVVGAAGARDLKGPAVPAEFPEAALVVPQAVSFAATDGMTIRGQLFLPPGGAGAAKRPAIAFFHGGSRRQMLLGWHSMQYYHYTYAFNQYLASRGYVVLSVNYRSGIGYGLEFREALDYGAAGASEFRDVLGAGLYLRGRSDVDAKRIGLWGGSYGGYLTALGLARASDLFAAGVDLHGVHDWNNVIRNFAPEYDPRRSRDVASIAFESSPLAAIASWRSPVLLIHGDDDRNVPFGETLELAAALRAQGVDFEELIFPDEVHDFLIQSRWLQAMERADAFFARRLAPR
ncbi:MAG: prolyl oligopeptidase family serine peptidase [Vicinamibacteria bacterium]